ncbi:MAG: HAMP domain-containing histidine kinase [Lachnospiraceae bacterium]|uniref:sensor histidine kinase n=1 Tax=uncultured Acetatifactor sp. TaxID=1671927 RepID=UPI00261211A1|nr:HAMP domain-containing sensor histidine kinase [uncultured Acetatifactor sp.]MCI8787545.1 HAMP domain-containing histidine kinase [Lachnospiraceae bacterium]
MKKSTLKRLGLGLLQHLLAAGVLFAVAGLLLNSYIAVESIDGTKVYNIFPMDAGMEFEESEVYYDLFRNAVSDITQLVALKRQLETDGVFDSEKRIDVTEYASEIGEDSGCAVTAVYTLDDIIKWGKSGVEYTKRFMSMSEFINYFGYCIYPENFTVDSFGQLVFDGFYRVDTGEGAEDSEESETTNMPSDGKSPEELAEISEKLEEYTDDQLEDLVFSYLMGRDLKGVELSREDDSSLTIYIPMLNCRYATVDGHKQLTGYAGNWVDYMQLQENVVSAIESLTLNYQRYQICNEAYEEGNSNVKYMVRMMTDEGMCTYTNVSRLADLADNEVTESFNEYRRYLIYYPDSLVFMGNTIFSEEELDEYISIYSYAYPDTTHIWLGVDSNYAIEEDAFYAANAVYQKIVPNVGRVVALIVILALSWLGIGIYLTVTAGCYVSEDGGQIWHLNRFDRIWTEILLLLAAGLAYGGLLGYRMIVDVAETAGAMPAQILGIQLTMIYRYGLFVAYGVYLSIAFNLVWYSLVRRAKVGNLWKDSFLYFFGRSICNSMKFIFRHRNSVVSTLLPYNVFLFSNLAGIAIVYKLWEKQTYVMLILGAMVVVDGIVGVFMFRRGAEQAEIVEGINRIRDGEVEFKLEADSLHGSSKELAIAVNNIGEGIRKAVQTSMEDERMKTDLITNVSHDIKTPLTSIINYVDLLKRLKIDEEPAKGYIDILDGKAQRLKQLTDDLVEASKISSGSIVLENAKLNLTELFNQGIGEFSEKLEEGRLQVVFEGDDTPAYVFADSRRMWRVVENLFNNICKYAMEGTRVYIEMKNREGFITVSVKNISRQQMSIRPEELTERFIRGDSSRTTEGSGLGLSIAKSLVQVQGGSFEIALDGDLFKVLLTFPEYDPSREEAQGQDMDLPEE